MFNIDTIPTDHFVEDSDGIIDNAGDFGGDIQAGPAYSRQFAQRIDGTNEYVVLTFNGYLASEHLDDVPNDAWEHGNLSDYLNAADTFIQVQVNYCHCTNPNDVGGTETRSDYRYWDSPIEDDVDTPQGRIVNLTVEDLHEAVNQMGA